MVKIEKRAMDRDLIRAEEDVLLDFQNTLIEAMNARGVNQAEFAEMLGVSKARVSQLLSSEANPTIKVVGRCLALLERQWHFELRSPAYSDFLTLTESRVRRSRAELFAAGANRQIESAYAWNAETNRAANENFAECREAA